MNDRHLDLLDLDAVRAGEAPAEDRAHAESCPSCRRELELLMQLSDDVRKLEPEAPRVPAAVDEAVLAEFRRPAARGKVIRFPAWRWVGPSLGLAAAAGLAWLLLSPPVPKAPVATVADRIAQAPPAAPAESESAAPASPVAAKKAPSAVSKDRGDVNGDGGVDILDAYRLAVLLREQSPQAADHDENADGSVDQKDVDGLAALVVAVR